MIENEKRVVILPRDGYGDSESLLHNLETLMMSPLARRLIGTIKLNDALHFPFVGPEIISMIREVVPAGMEIMIDPKIADVSDTNKNTLAHYRSYNPNIVTVTSTVSSKSLMAIKEALPDTKIAIVDTLTDISATELMSRYNMDASLKIARTLLHFENCLKSDNPVEIVVCSPLELEYLGGVFKERYKFLTPGIRSPHMAKDHQERITSAYEALNAGAWRIVMGAQIAKGNPKAGISPEESQQITLDEINRYFSEKAMQ